MPPRRLSLRLYTADFRPNTANCVLMKFSKDHAIVGLMTDDDEAEFRKLTQNFVDRRHQNHLLISKGTLIDFHRQWPAFPSPWNVQGITLRWWTPSTWAFTWTINWTELITQTHCTWRVRRDSALRTLWSFGVTGALLRTIYNLVVNSSIVDSVLWWSSSITEKERKNCIKSSGSSALSRAVLWTLWWKLGTDGC